MRAILTAGTAAAALALASPASAALIGFYDF